jgi:MFS family permease
LLRPWQIFFINIPIAIFSVIYDPCVVVFVSDICDSKSIVPFQYSLEINRYISNVLGPLIGIYLYSNIGFNGVVILNAITFLIAGYIEVGIKYVRKLVPITSVGPMRRVLKDIVESSIYARKNKWIFTMIIMFGIINMITIPFSQIIIPILLTKWRILDVGRFFALVALSSIIGGVVMKKFKLANAHCLLVSLLIAAGCIFLFGFESLAMIKLYWTLAAIAFGLAVPLLQVSLNVYYVDVVNSAYIGRVFVLRRLVSQGLVPMGLFLIPILYSKLSHQITIFVLASSIVLLAPFVFFLAIQSPSSRCSSSKR